MRLDVNCVRDVLLELEEFPMGYHPMDSFKKSIFEHGKENVLYTLYKLHEAKYINSETMVDESGYPHCLAVYNMTFAGHQFLESIREPKIWAKVQSTIGKVGVGSFNIVLQIATQVATELISTVLNGSV